MGSDHLGCHPLYHIHCAGIIPQIETFFKRVMGTQGKGQTAVGKWYLDGPYAITVGETVRFGGDVRDRARVRSVSDQVMRRIICLAQESASRVQRAGESPDRIPE